MGAFVQRGGRPARAHTGRLWHLPVPFWGLSRPFFTPFPPFLRASRSSAGDPGHRRPGKPLWGLGWPPRAAPFVCLKPTQRTAPRRRVAGKRPSRPFHAPVSPQTGSSQIPIERYIMTNYSHISYGASTGGRAPERPHPRRAACPCFPAHCQFLRGGCAAGSGFCFAPMHPLDARPHGLSDGVRVVCGLCMARVPRRRKHTHGRWCVCFRDDTLS